MKIETYQPNEFLKPFIKGYQIIESHEEIINRVLPNTSFAIAFQFKGQVNYIIDSSPISLPTSVISGLRKSVRLINYTKNTSAIIILFKETGAAAFFKEPLNELFEASVSLDNFINTSKIRILEDRLSCALNNVQRIDIIEELLMSKLYSSKSDKLILTAINNIYKSKGSLKIKKLADILYISHDAFEKRFRRIVGTSPKKFSSIVRMKAILNQKQAVLNLSDIAFDAGYFDQAHFNKDFKSFTGQTPTDFFNSPLPW